MYLPNAPTQAEKLLYLNSGRKSLYVASIFTTSSLLIGMGLFVLINPLFVPYTLFVFVTGLYLTLSYGVGLGGKEFDYRRHRGLVSKWIDKSTTHHVDIFLPVCGEPMAMLRNTWGYVKDLYIAHEGLISVYVLDDSHSEEVKALAKVFNFNYLDRDNNDLKKAGNLRHAFAKTNGDFFIILDADFCPRKDFLIETLPYMFEDPDTGIVQTPQYFSSSSSLGGPRLNVIERGSAQMQELFYRLIQVSRDTFNGAICVGTSALYRRSFLVKHGGTAAIGWSEDVHTGVLLMKDHKKIKYIPLILSKGACAGTWKQFFTQFYRWSTGSMSLMLSKSFWKSDLTIAQKICFTTGFGFYVTTGMSALLAFTPSIYLLMFKPEYVFWFNILWAAPSMLLTNVYMRFWQKTGYSWDAVECRAVSCYAHLFALYDILLNRTEAWIPTGGKGQSGRYSLFTTFVVVHNVLIGAVLCMLISYRTEVGLLNVLPLMLLYVYHLLTLKSVLFKK